MSLYLFFQIDLFKMSSVEQNSSQTHSESKVEFKKTKEETEESVLSDSTHVIVKVSNVSTVESQYC